MTRCERLLRVLSRCHAQCGATPHARAPASALLTRSAAVITCLAHAGARASAPARPPLDGQRKPLLAARAEQVVQSLARSQDGELDGELSVRGIAEGEKHGDGAPPRPTIGSAVCTPPSPCSVSNGATGLTARKDGHGSHCGYYTSAAICSKMSPACY